MDWRNRKYYVACFDPCDTGFILKQLKNIKSVTIHCPTQFISTNYTYIFKDETFPRGYYNYLIGCSIENSEAVEYELRKSQINKNSMYYGWREIKRSI